MKFARYAYAYAGVTAATIGSALAPKALAFGTTNTPLSIASSSVNNTDVRGNIVKIANTVLDIVLLLAGILAVFYLVYSGILYITAGGNADRVKQARSGIINAVIGIIIIVAAYFIINFALSIGNSAVSS